MVFRSRSIPAQSLKISVGLSLIKQVRSHRHLGVFFNETLTWTDHINHVLTKASPKLGLLRRLRGRLPRLIIRDLYLSCILPSLEYGSVAWCGLSSTDATRLEKFNRAAGRLIANVSPASHTPHNIILARAGLQTLVSPRQVLQISFANRVLHGCLPRHILLATTSWRPAELSPQTMVLRSCDNVRLPRPKKNCLKTSPLFVFFSLFSALPSELKKNLTKAKVRAFFFT